MYNSELTKGLTAMEARKNFGEIMDRAVYKGERFIVERSGKPAVMILSVKDYEDLMETLSEQADPAYQKQLVDSYREYKQGKTKTIEQAIAELEAMSE